MGFAISVSWDLQTGTTKWPQSSGQPKETSQVVADIFFMLFLSCTFAPSSFLLLVVRPGAPNSFFAHNSDALCS